MRGTQQFSVTLPTEMVGMVKSMVATGAYATESEVFHDGLRAPMARDRALEHWLHEQVAPSLDALKADPSRAFRPEQVRARIAAEHEAANGKA